eukprot:CAMPEP_0175078866 /NCGR_PEP_ID=MMETSP0052_2-20121109/24434_1 /TAXON_ID=51329 ORGANISM="Polytomella parva, Strain SAG 63-3" /NCGR_SAMPLE_ID=MMETSP0052_2 /ASSEMBLY_ACC=CAM_ASM_000194 /LENGTH=128 /DNA_ID=CAMNT_0016348991 /DNA_START=24 /DNA_END=410 /DNA_ORIENTATION=+
MASEEPISYATIDSLRPGASNVNLKVKVTRAKTVVERPKGSKGLLVVECLAGDHTGVALFAARNANAELIKEGSVLSIENARVEMFKGVMRLPLDNTVVVKVVDGEDISPREDFNISLIEFNLILAEN